MINFHVAIRKRYLRAVVFFRRKRQTGGGFVCLRYSGTIFESILLRTTGPDFAFLCVFNHLSQSFNAISDGIRLRKKPGV